MTSFGSRNLLVDLVVVFVRHLSTESLDFLWKIISAQLEKGTTRDVRGEKRFYRVSSAAVQRSRHLYPFVTKQNGRWSGRYATSTVSGQVPMHKIFARCLPVDLHEHLRPARRLVSDVLLHS